MFLQTYKKSKKVINTLLRRWIDGRTAETMDLIKYNKADPDKTYHLGISILEGKPTDEMGAFFASWGAWRKNNFQEAIRFIDIAIDANPDKFDYWYLKGACLQGLAMLEESLKSYQRVVELNPEHPFSWKNIAKLSDRLGIKIDLPRNTAVLEYECWKAYKNRDWKKLVGLIGEMTPINPLAAAYWDLMRRDFLLLIDKPSHEWAKFFKKCVDQKDRFLEYDAFSNMFHSYLKEGHLEKVSEFLPMFARTYKKCIPSHYFGGICALMLRHSKIKECLEFIENTEKSFEDEDTRNTFRLKIHPYRVLASRASNSVSPAMHGDTGNEISETLQQLMTSSVPKESVISAVTDECVTCWDLISKSDPVTLQDLRYNDQQATMLQHKILHALSNKESLSLIRLGDSDSYGFSAWFPSFYSDEMITQTESMWWGKTIGPILREKIIRQFISSIKSADMIGLPGFIRLARDLKIDRGQKATPLHYKYQTLFMGIQSLIRENSLRKDIWWLDEYCNFSLGNPTFMKSAFDLASKVLVVTCFEIPPGNFLHHPKVQRISIPPHHRVSSKSVGFDQILPELTDQKNLEIAKAVVPGTLLLVSAGFSGKTFLEVGRSRGAVSIDFGSAIDLIMGYQTRAAELHIGTS